MTSGGKHADVDHLSQALLTPVIALLALYIAWQQWRTARSKFRLDYFNRRFPIYAAAMRLAAGIAKTTSVSYEELHGFLTKTREAEFFFNDDIKRYCDELYREALAIACGREKLKAVQSDAERSKSQDILLQRVAWFNEQVDEIPRKLDMFLKIEGRA